MSDNFDNTPDSGGGFWTFILIFLLVVGFGYAGYMFLSNGGTSDYWEIRISHTPNGFEVKKYDYDAIMKDAIEKTNEIMENNVVQ